MHIVLFPRDGLQRRGGVARFCSQSRRSYARNHIVRTFFWRKRFRKRKRNLSRGVHLLLDPEAPDTQYCYGIVEIVSVSIHRYIVARKDPKKCPPSAFEHLFLFCLKEERKKDEKNCVFQGCKSDNFPAGKCQVCSHNTLDHP